MATIEAVCEAIANTIAANIPGVQAASSITNLPDLPAVYVAPNTARFEMTMGRGLDEWSLNIFIIVDRSPDDESADKVLKSLVSGSGPSSVREVIFKNPSVGLSDTQVAIRGMKGYGGHFRESGVSMTGAILTAQVFTDGRA